jgi:hypothetical protein
VEADSPVRRPGGQPRHREPARGLRPLRRRPKTLDSEPLLLDVSRGSGTASVISGPEHPGRSAQPRARAGGGSATTGEQGALAAADADGGAPDPQTLRRAREIATRLAVPRPRRDLIARRGMGEVASLPYRGGSDDIDLDRTVEQLAEHPVPEEEDIIVRERVRTRRSVVLLVDVSGSMRGERVRTAAATVGALAAELARDDLAVIAFWSDAAVLSRPATWAASASTPSPRSSTRRKSRSSASGGSPTSRHRPRAASPGASPSHSA